jgi:hypothetical protein
MAHFIPYFLLQNSRYHIYKVIGLFGGFFAFISLAATPFYFGNHDAFMANRAIISPADTCE